MKVAALAHTLLRPLLTHLCMNFYEKVSDKPGGNLTFLSNCSLPGPPVFVLIIHFLKKILIKKKRPYEQQVFPHVFEKKN